MKIVAVLGSPRKNGNSETLAEAFLEEAERLGAQVERFRLSALTYQGCTACLACKTTSERCVLKDELTPVLDALIEADTFVLAVPLYFLDMPSQVKALIDRWFSFLKPGHLARPDPSRLLAGKQMVLVVAQGAPESYFVDFVVRYDFIFKLLGFQPMHLIRGARLSGDPNDAAKRDDLLEKARITARKVLAGEPSDADIPAYALRSKVRV